MPITQSQVDALKTFINQGEVWAHVTAPSTGVGQQWLAGNPGTPVGTEAGGGALSLGITSGPATLEYKPTFAGVTIEQAYGDVAPRVTKEAVTLKFKCAEATYKRIRIALQTGTYNQTGPVSGTYRHWLEVGGKTFFSTDCVALVSKVNDTPARYEWVTIYAAMSVDGIKLDWKRGETRMVEVTITGYADVTRPEGDQLFQLGQEDAADGGTGY